MGRMIARDDNFKPYPLGRTRDRVAHVLALPPQKFLLPLIAVAVLMLGLYWSPWLLLAIPVGIVLQYVIEYCMHRFLYHMAAPDEVNGLFEWLYQSHWGHHDFPNNPNLWGGTSVWFVPVVSVAFLGIETAILWGFGVNQPWLAAFICVYLGSIPTYITYEWAHVTAHAAGQKNALERYITREHAKHHFQDFDTNYHVNAGGILVDKAFGTAYLPGGQKVEHIRTMGLAPDDPRLVTLREMFAADYGISPSDRAKALR